MKSARQTSDAASGKPVKPANPWRRRVRRLLVIVACVYVSAACLVRMFEGYFVFPGAHFLSADETRIVPVAGTELLQLKTADGTPIVGLFGPALDSNAEPVADAAAQPAVIFFYGNGSCVAGCENIFWHIRRMGLNVIIPEYPGYGSSGGSASEAGCNAAADAAYDELLRRGFTASGRIDLVGWSMGGGPAVDLASRRPVGKLALYDTFTNLHDMGRIVMPWFPTPLVLSYKFDNIAKLPSIRCPIFLVHGQADSVVPPYMEDQLAAAATGSSSVTVVKIPGAEHNTIFEQGGDELWARLTQFLNDGPAASDAGASTRGVR